MSKPMMFKKSKSGELMLGKVRHALLVGYAGLLLAIIILASVAGGSGVGEPIRWLTNEIPMFDKVGHFLLFGTLAFLVHWTLLERRFSRTRWVVVSIFIASLVLAEECTQIWLPHRNFDVVDIIADLAGILVFSLFAYFLMRRNVQL